MWIEESAKKSKGLKDMYNLGSVDVYIKDRLPEHIDVDFVLKYISTLLPGYILKKIDIIYVGEFHQFKERDINAFYDNGAIFITNEHDDEQDMIDDIVHEIAHSNEERHQDIIYSDGSLEKEFMS